METLAVISLIALIVQFFLLIAAGLGDLEEQPAFRLLLGIVGTVFFASYIWMLILIL